MVIFDEKIGKCQKFLSLPNSMKKLLWATSLLGLKDVKKKSDFLFLSRSESIHVKIRTTGGIVGLWVLNKWRSQKKS